MANFALLANKKKDSRTFWKLEDKPTSNKDPLHKVIALQNLNGSIFPHDDYPFTPPSFDGGIALHGGLEFIALR